MENEHVKGWCFTDETVSRFDEILELVELKNGSAKRTPSYNTPSTSVSWGNSVRNHRARLTGQKDRSGRSFLRLYVKGSVHESGEGAEALG